MNSKKKLLSALIAGIIAVCSVTGCNTTGTENTAVHEETTTTSSASEDTAAVTAPVTDTQAEQSAADSDSEETDDEAETEKTYNVTSKTLPYHFMIAAEALSSTIDVYYINGSDVPYLEVEDWLGMQKRAVTFSTFSATYDITLSKEGDILRLIRDNGTSASINFKTDIMEFDDYNSFITSRDTNLLDIIILPKKDTDGNPIYLKTLDSSLHKYGHTKIMDLSYYDIDLVRVDSNYYIPLQTLSDVFMAKYGKTAIYNGENVFVYAQTPELLKNEDGTLTETGEAVFGKDNEYSTGTISETMAKFNYDELCFAFDNTYGLKESHNIWSFRELVREMGYEETFLGTDSRKIDEALCRIIAEAIDDKHSKYLLASYASGIDYRDELIGQYGEGRARTAEFALLDEYLAERAEFYPDGVPGYEEIGDTAFISFDEFTTDTTAHNYYNEAPSAENTDTIGIVSYAVQQIIRPGSPIKNVVLDLSCNTGGDAEAAAYTLAAFLGTASISVEDPITGALATNDYVADTNFDKQFDENDTLAGRGLSLFCLESNVSFSCGNLVPAVFKEDPHVTLLGQRSSGGSCAVAYLSTAIGSVMRISSSQRMSYLRNGSFYDIDQGVEADIFISKSESFYDRENLVKYINSML